MRHQNIQGIILRKHNIGEYDQFITLYSPTLGKIDAYAKGVRKINSSFSGHLEVLNICELQLYKSIRGYTITQCQVIQTFKPIKKDLQLSMLSFLLIEIFYKITPSDEHGDELFNLLSTTLNKLNNKEKSFFTIECFKIKILKLAGALPDISQCSNCNHKWKETDTIYINHEDHIVCDNCKPSSNNKEIVQFNMMKLFHFIAHSTHEEIEKIKLQKEEENKLRKICDLFLHNYINCELKSQKIAAEVLV